MENNEMNQVIVKQKSNKGIIIVLIILLIGALGYIVYDKFITKDTTPTTNVPSQNTENKKILKKDETKELVYEDLNDTLTDKVGDKYTYIIPQINIDSEYATEINNKIISEVKSKYD